VLAEAATLAEAVPAVVEGVGRTSGWQCGSLWVVDSEQGVLRWVQGWCDPALNAPEFDQASRTATLGPGIGLPGRVWASGTAAWVADVSADANFPRRPATVLAGLHAAIAFPVAAGARVLGVMEFFSRDVRPPDERLLDMMLVIGRQVGQYVARRRAEEGLRASEARNAAVLDAALDAVVSMDHEGRVSEWNPAAERAFGYARAEAVGREMADMIIPPQYRDSHRAGLATYLTTGEGPAVGRRFEITALRKDGTEFPVELAITRLPTAGPPAFTGHLRDISEQKRADEARRMVESRFQRLVEHSPLSTQLFWPDGRTRQVNAAFTRLFGITLDELNDYNILRDPQLVATGIMSLMARAFAGEAVVIDPIPYVPDRGEYVGQTRWAGAHVYPVKDDAGRVEEVVLVHHDVTEQRVAEEAMRQSERRLRSLVEQSAAGIAQTDLNGRIQFANDRFCQIVGYPRDEVVGLRVHDLTHPDDVAVTTKLVAEGAATGREYRMEKRYVRRDGSVVWVAVNASIIRGEAGQPQSIMGVVIDVSDRRLAEAAVREGEERLRLGLDAGNTGTWDWDIASGRVTWSDRVYEFHGVPKGEFAGSVGDFARLVHPEDQERVQAAIRHSVETGSPYGVEFRVVHRDGAVRWLTTNGRVYYDDAGRPVRMLGATSDVTARKEAEAERDRLLDSERGARSEAETLVRVGRALSGELDLHKLVQAATDAAIDLTGAAFGAFFYTVPDPQGGHLTLYTISGVPREEFSKFPMPRATDLFGPTLRGEAVVRSDDITADPRYGHSAPHHGMPEGHLPVRSYLAVPVRSRSGEVLGAMFLGHPEPARFSDRHARLVDGVVTQAAVAIDNARLYDRERVARTEAECQSRMKDEFLATLSHELRTPLNAILGWSQILAGGSRNAEDLAEGLRVIERNARAQNQIIADLLEMSRIIAGKVRLDVQRVPLTPVIEAAVDTVRHAAEAKGVRLQVVLDSHAGPVSGDPARLQQIFWNLLSNAVRHSHRGGRVQVLLERVNSHLEVSVIDEGEGIDASFISAVFDRFRQADSSTTRRHGGLGLGLSIVKQLVELHGGAVRAKSPGPGKGATFIVTLPLTPIHAEPEPDVERRHPHAAPDRTVGDDACIKLGGVRVLVVDDEPDARALVKRLLEDCDAEVTTAGSAAEALEALRRDRPHVLLSDIGMPGEDGYSLIRRVRALAPAEGGDVPAVALTAYARSEDRTRALRAGFIGHVAKPVEPAELLATVAAVARRSGP
jgi:PAS domain S-box-containing protein